MTPNPKDECREAFETEAEEKNYQLLRDKAGEYHFERTRVAWKYWQAAWNHKRSE